jgi:hypothetical protein
LPPVAPRPVGAAPVSQAVITAALNTLMETWPESLRLEILQTNLADARIAMPVDAGGNGAQARAGDVCLEDDPFVDHTRDADLRFPCMMLRNWNCRSR